jgi:hypothetical protein
MLSFEAQFDFELHCLNKCLGMEELFLNSDSNMNSCDDPNLRLHTPK